MSELRALVGRASTVTRRWSGFLTVVCILAVLNMAFWSAHPTLTRLAGYDGLGQRLLVAQFTFVVLLSFVAVAAFSVTGLSESIRNLRSE
jgi:dolichyl-phosphate-mannose--protein O-mannosyl transferase